ncbi:MAG: sulfite exporter TauE/SafE family protein [Bacteroidales bacterium]
MSWIEVIILLTAGFAVGFINTMAGGATVISLAAMIVLGLPISVANATHRVAAMFQTLASSGAFFRQKVLDLRTGLKLGIPVTLGSIIGAWVAVDIDEKTFELIAGFAMLTMLVAMIFKPALWLQGKAKEPTLNPSPWQYLLFFALGLYGGFIYIGIGYFLLAALVLGTGFDLLRANALKVFIVLLYVPFTLVLFVINDLIHWPYALVLSAGQATGAYIAARVSVKMGTGFIRWFMIIFILVTLAELFGIINLKALFDIR